MTSRARVENGRIILNEPTSLPDGLQPRAVEVLCRSLECLGERVKAAPSSLEMRDEGDRPFIEVALTGNADALVTGNRRDFPAACVVPILTPAEFLERLGLEA